MKKKIILISLISVTISSFLVFFLRNYSTYTLPYNHAFFSRIYSDSPYVKGPKASEGIGDDGLYAFAGYYYIHGGDISQVNFENPPLGKYLIGLSILLLNNQNAINLLYIAIFFITLYWLSFLLLHEHIWAAFTIAIASIDRFFQSHLLYSLLDLPMSLCFLLATFYYFLARFVSPKNYLLSSVFFGLASSMKFFPSLILFLMIFTFDAYKNDHKNFIFYLKTLLLIPFLYTLSHGAYFYFHPSLLDFLRYQNWIIHWRLGNPVVPGNILSNLLVGRYRTWWGFGDWIVDKEWSPLTALLLITGLVSIFTMKKRNSQVWLLYSLTVVFLAYLTVGTVGFAKYALPIYPFLIILTLYALKTYLDPQRMKQSYDNNRKR